MARTIPGDHMRIALFAFLLFAASQAYADPPTADLLARLRQGGFVLYFRHSETPNYIDPHEGNFDDCGQ